MLDCNLVAWNNLYCLLRFPVDTPFYGHTCLLSLLLHLSMLTLIIQSPYFLLIATGHCTLDWMKMHLLTRKSHHRVLCCTRVGAHTLSTLYIDTLSIYTLNAHSINTLSQHTLNTLPRNPFSIHTSNMHSLSIPILSIPIRNPFSLQKGIVTGVLGLSLILALLFTVDITDPDGNNQSTAIEGDTILSYLSRYTTLSLIPTTITIAPYPNPITDINNIINNKNNNNNNVLSPILSALKWSDKRTGVLQPLALLGMPHV